MTWERGGSCGPAQCKGACCRYVTFYVPKLTDDKARFYELHGFTVARELHERMDAVLVPQPCGALTVDGMCSIYDERPDVCREFPQAPEQQLGLPNCGFTFQKVEAVA